MARRPYVLLSVAMSADGYIDDSTSHRLVLSDAADLDRVDELRAASDAILVGARTIRSDSPLLAVRSQARRQQRQQHGLPPNPAKVTLTGSGDLDPAARFFAEADSPPLVYAPAAAAGLARQRLGELAVVIAVPGAADAAELDWILADLVARGISHLMVEGGAYVLSQFLGAGLADELRLAVAPVLVADPAAPRLLAGHGKPADLGGRMRLADVARVGDMAVLTYLPRGRA